jgi:hypothetical protein
MGMSHRPFEVFAHARAFCEHAGQQEGEEHSEPAVDREAGVEIKKLLTNVNDFIVKR